MNCGSLTVGLGFHMSGQRLPEYRLLDGKICRRDVHNGDWEPLDRQAAQRLLAERCDGWTLTAEQSARIKTSHQAEGGD